MAYHAVPIGEDAPSVVNAVMEITRGSRNKYEYSEELDEIILDRVIHSTITYPTDYGYIPETRSEDGDHLDVLVLSTEALATGVIAPVRIVGGLNMVDGGEKDWKVLAVVNKDPRWDEVKDITDVNEHLKKEIKHFFEVYKHLEGKEVTVEEWVSKDDIFAVIAEARERYSKEDHS